MLRIRLKRVGRKHDPSYRIVVTEKHRGPKSGKYVENLGFYDPRSDKREVDGVRARYWLEEGARPSDTVHNIFVAENIIEGEKINALPKKTAQVPEKGEKKPEEALGEGESEEKTSDAGDISSADDEDEDQSDTDKGEEPADADNTNDSDKPDSPSRPTEKSEEKSEEERESVEAENLEGTKKEVPEGEQSTLTK